MATPLFLSRGGRAPLGFLYALSCTCSFVCVELEVATPWQPPHIVEMLLRKALDEPRLMSAICAHECAALRAR